MRQAGTLQARSYFLRKSIQAVALLLMAYLELGPVRAQQNLALNRPVISSGANFGGVKPAALTDGTVNTYTAPAAASGTLGFYYQVDLGRRYRLDRILLRNRGDGCCPERLSHYKVEVYAEGGDLVGPLNWSATIRADGSNSGANGVDTITAGLSPTEDFAGRYVRVVNHNGAGYSPQLSEIEVYGGLMPEVRFFVAENDALAVGESTVLQWELRYARGAFISGVGEVSPDKGSALIRPQQTTFHTLTATNEIGSVSATVGVGVGERLAPPVITEFAAGGSAGFNDEDGDRSDWIELKNPNRFSLDLAGYALTDDPAQLTKWVFPKVKIAPDSYLVVFASGKNRRESSGNLHANFRLDAAGDYLALVAGGGTAVTQQFPTNYPAQKKFPQQPQNVS